MKKITFLMCALTLTVSLAAQQKAEKMDNSVIVKSNSPAVMVQKADNPLIMNAENFILPSRKVAAEQWDTAITYDFSALYYIENSFHPGITHGLLWFIAWRMPRLYLPYMDTIRFESVYRNTPGKWTLNDSVWAENDSVLELPFGGIGDYVYSINPTLSDVKDRKITQSNKAGDSIYNFTLTYADYTFGEHVHGAWAASYPQYASLFEPRLVGPLSYTSSITQCGMTTDSITHGSTGDPTSSVNDFNRVGAGERGKYCYGTKLRVDDLSSPRRKVYADSIGVLVRNQDIMYIDTVILPIHREDAARTVVGTQEEMFPEGATLTLTIHPISSTSEGNRIKLDSIIAKATATQEDFLMDEDGGCGTIAFAFKDVNALGVESVKPAIIEGNFFVVLTGYNDAVVKTLTKDDGTQKDTTLFCDFGIYSDYYNPINGTTYLLYKDTITTFWSNGGSNIAMSFNAMFPTVFADSAYYELGIPANGGYSYYYDGEKLDEEYGAGAILRTNVVDPDEWEIITDADWLDFALDDQYVADYSAMIAAFTADANTSAEPRTAKVKIGGRGKYIEYTVTQLGGGTAVENIDSKSHVAATYQNGNIELRYDRPFNTVELYSVSGQKVASYPAGKAGRMSIDAAGLTNGVYLISLIGDTKETIRVIK